RYRIGGVAPGDYFAFVYNAGKYLAFSRTAPFVHVVAGSTTVQRLTLFDSRFWSNGPLYISGSVTDVTTRAPVAGAFVSSVFWASQEQFAFNGATVPAWGVTDEAGRFTISGPVIVDDDGRIGMTPITVTKLGYEPATLVGRGPDPYGFGPTLPTPIPPNSVLNLGLVLRPANPTRA